MVYLISTSWSHRLEHCECTDHFSHREHREKIETENFKCIHSVPGGYTAGTLSMSLRCIYDVLSRKTGVCPQCEALPIRIAEAVLDSDEENRPTIRYETGDENSDAEAEVALAEAVFQRTGSRQAQRRLVRARASLPYHHHNPLPHRMALGSRESRFAREQSLVRRVDRHRSAQHRRGVRSTSHSQYVFQARSTGFYGTTSSSGDVFTRRPSGSFVGDLSVSGRSLEVSCRWSSGGGRFSGCEMESRDVGSFVGSGRGGDNGSPVV